MAPVQIHRRRSMRLVALAALSLAIIACAAHPAVAGLPGPAGPAPTPDRNLKITIYELASDYSFGYFAGVKQPLGSFKNGLSIHQITRSSYPDEVKKGNPDFVFWVNELEGEYGVHHFPTAEFFGTATNPGGMMTFAPDGTIWYTFGARASELPLDLFRSTEPYATSDYLKILDDFETFASSTTPCVNVHDDDLMLFWRYRSSGSTDARVRFRQYHIPTGFEQPAIEVDIGRGVAGHPLGDIGIEQLWTRFDPRFGYTFLTWQWFDIEDHRMGANPFLYSADAGDSWHFADGRLLNDLPLDYTEIDDVIVPYDHLALEQSTAWLVADIGIAPDGTFWMTLPYGDADQAWWVRFWRFDGTTWQWRTMTWTMPTAHKSHACGATRDYLAFVNSSIQDFNRLLLQTSSDGGQSWTDPVVIEELDPDQHISWVSFVQPADAYDDNIARFFYAYYDMDDGVPGFRYKNNIRWISVDLDPCPADLDDDQAVDVLDLLILLGLWGTADPDADLNADGIVDVLDLLILLDQWGPCP